MRIALHKQARAVSRTHRRPRAHRLLAALAGVAGQILEHVVRRDHDRRLLLRALCAQVCGDDLLMMARCSTEICVVQLRQQQNWLVMHRSDHKNPRKAALTVDYEGQCAQPQAQLGSSDAQPTCRRSALLSMTWMQQGRTLGSHFSSSSAHTRRMAAGTMTSRGHSSCNAIHADLSHGWGRLLQTSAGHSLRITDYQRA